MPELSKKLKPTLPFVLAILAGITMTYGFAPFYFGIAPIVSCAVFLGTLKKQSPLKGFLTGWLYGLAMFGSGVYWIYVSIHDYGNAPPPLAFLITLLLVMGMALYPAALGALLNKYFPRQGIVRCVLAFPALWVIFEILRGWILTGFPWLYVGYGEMGNHLAGYAPVGGVWLVSWMTVLFAGFCYSLLDYFYENSNRPWLRNSYIIGIFAIWGVAFGLNQTNWTTPTTRKLEVALIQGNIPQLLRWDPEHINQIISVYESLTQRTLNSDLIIWPEGAIPLPLPISAPLFERVANILKSQNAALIAGVPVETSDGMHYYNSLVTAGNAQGIYHKEHLVPFGEYVPLENWLRGLIGFFDLPMSSIISGPSNQSDLIAQGYRFAPAICYEIAYPMYVQKMSKDADFILTVSNDAWFGRSIGPAQHLQIAQFRALEEGKYLLRATNTGYTAIVGPDGELQSIAPQFEQNILTGSITVMAGQTPWSRWGAWPVIGALLVTLGAAYALSKRKR